MTTIAKLSVALTASTSQFSRAMQKAGGSLRSLGGPLGKTAKLAAGLGAVSLAAAAGGLTALTISEYKAVDALGKMSDQIGLQTEALAGLQIAAQLGGNTTAELRKGLLRMVKSIGDANQGLATQARAFEQLGLNVEDLRKLSADEQFRLVGDALMQLPSQTDRVNAAFAIFGKVGVGLLSTLKDGREGLDAAQRQADAFGLSLSRVDAAKIEQANDSVLLAKSAFTGLARQIAVQTAPFITAAAQKMVEFATEGEGAAGLVSRSMEGVTVVVGTVANAIQTVLQGWTKLHIQALKTEEAFRGFFSDPRELADLNRQIRDLEFNLEGLQEQDWGLKVQEAMKGIQEEASAAAEEIAAAADEMKEFDADADAAANALAEQEERMRSLEQSASRVFDQTRTPLEKYEKQIGELNELLDEQLIDFETYSRAVRAARADLEGTGSDSGSDAIGQFMQGTASRLALNASPGSRGRPQKVEDPQLKETNERLASIDRNIRTHNGATAQ